MTANELRKKYLEFFKEKEHAIIPSASVVPENDPTVLFTTAGMHPLVPYLMGEKHPLGKRLANSQKCIRTGDIDDVGDNRHLTFFEMLGNWSLGDYFKREAIEWSWEFMTDSKWLGLDPKRIYITVFAGDGEAGISRDDDSIGIWKEQYEKVGIEAGVCELDRKAEKNSRIFLLGKEDNFWGPAGETGPCGPCSEMFYDVRPDEGELIGTHDEMVKSFRLMEIWNDVFMEFNKTSAGSYEKMAQQNVDTGMGLERTITVMSGKENVFDTDLFLPIIQKIEELSGKKYADEENKKPMRIIADHIKAAVFIIADGVEPSNVQRGYVLRRLIRRAVRQGHLLGINENFTAEIAKVVQRMYGEIYLEIADDKILRILEEEENKFRKTLENGLDKIEKYLNNPEKNIIFRKVGDQAQEAPVFFYSDAADLVFDLYQTNGFPFEMSLEELKKRAISIGVSFDEGRLKKEFDERLEKHQELSRTASAGMFKGGLADAKEKTTQLHTAAHLMLAGLRKVLGDHIHQKGSNINGERIRFDFSHPDKMTEEQKKAVEEYVNAALKENAEVIMEEMTPDEAREAGAEGAFEHKYGDMVKVYEIPGFSKEICGGPHVKNTSEIKGVFRITKEESSSAGVRRIKAVVAE
ncbi:MAG: alanyl-tRNA synthetase [Patescibacteria group bacterium]|nr:alanyl-tRNA synthetase [Patescibacteria group bacterium]